MPTKTYEKRCIAAYYFFGMYFALTPAQLTVEAVVSDIRQRCTGEMCHRFIQYDELELLESDARHFSSDFFLFEEFCSTTVTLEPIHEWKRVSKTKLLPQFLLHPVDLSLSMLVLIRSPSVMTTHWVL